MNFGSESIKFSIKVRPFQNPILVSIMSTQQLRIEGIWGKQTVETNQPCFSNKGLKTCP